MGAEQEHLGLDGILALRRGDRRLEAFGVRAHHSRQVARTLRPDVRNGLRLVEDPERPDEGEAPRHAGPASGRVRSKCRSHRRRDEVGSREPRRLEEILGGEDPVELSVEKVMPLGPRKSGNGRNHDPAALGEAIEKGRPAREPPDPGQEADRLARPLLPDPAHAAVDLDRPCADPCRRSSGRFSRFGRSSGSSPAHCKRARGSGCASDSGSAWGTARCCDGNGLGHQWFSHSSSKSPEI